MDSKPFYYFSLFMGSVFILIAFFILFKYSYFIQFFAPWKIYMMSVAMVAYGSFRIWRARKMMK